MTASTSRNQVEKRASNCPCEGSVGAGSRTRFVFSPRMSASSRCVSAELVSSKAVFMDRRFPVRAAWFASLPVSIPFDHQRSITTAEPQGIAHRDVDSTVSGNIRDEIQVAVGIRKFIIDCWRDDVVANRKATGPQFNRTTRALHVTQARLD